MFLKLALKKLVTVSPKDLGPTVNRQLERYLRDAVEGKPLPDIGIVLAVLDILEPHLLEGKVLDSGAAQFPLTYLALVYKLFEGEVLDIQVTEVKKDGFLGTSGPSSFYVSKRNMPVEYMYEGDSALPVFVTKDGQKSVRVGETTRIRIFAPLPNPDGFVCGTMEGEYLGPR
jgi:DNA-directed RNA polymerase subunit E'/Rpb7